MKTLKRVGWIFVLSIFLAGCAEVQNQQTYTGPRDKPCPSWQSYANCAQNH